MKPRLGWFSLTTAELRERLRNLAPDSIDASDIRRELLNRKETLPE